MDESADAFGGSICFDRVAGEYDRTRALPEKTLTQILASELQSRGGCLEIGVGTGRLALPLAERGIPMVGVDLSRRMLERLRERAGGLWPFPIAIADATALPFKDGTMGAALAAHVLHLIPDWRGALREAVRVVRPGGVVVVDVGNWRASGIWSVLRDRFCKEAGIRRPFVGTQDPREVSAHMRSMGARLRSLPPISETTTVTMQEQIAALEHGVFSFTWQLEEPARRAAAARTAAWARRRIGPLDQQHQQSRRVVLRAYDLPKH